jgi:hypothetical protein
MRYADGGKARFWTDMAEMAKRPGPLARSGAAMARTCLANGDSWAEWKLRAG